MKILIFSSLELPYTKDARFTGLERLAVQFAEELQKTGHDVTLLADKSTVVPKGVKFLPCEGYSSGKRSPHAEVWAYAKYQHLFRAFNVIYDIGHLHLIARNMPNLPTCNMLNHAPVHARYPKAPYNIVSWSKWGVWAFRQYYNQDARYQETLAVDPDVYHPDDNSNKRGERWLTIGRMSPDKGNLEAAQLCKAMKIPLDICGGRGSELSIVNAPLTEYEEQCRKIADGDLIRFLGEVDETTKVKLMQTCKGLIYATNHTELTSHKLIEALMCGAPVVVPNIGGIPEMVVEGVNAWLCVSADQFINGMKRVGELEPMRVHKFVVEKHNIHTVVKNYVKLFEEVANGARW